MTLLNPVKKKEWLELGNIKDLEKIPTEIKKNVNFYPVKTIQQVLGIAFPTILDKVPPKI